MSLQIFSGGWNNARSGCNQIGDGLSLNFPLVLFKVSSIRPATLVVLAGTRSASTKMATENMSQFVCNRDKALLEFQSIVDGDAVRWNPAYNGLDTTRCVLLGKLANSALVV